MKARHFDDFKAGDRFQSEPYEVTEQQIIEFAKEFDPQEFHTNPAVAKRTMFKGLIASGWHTAAVSMRLFVQTMNVPGGMIGLGVDELRWPNPMREGDSLRLEIEILEVRPSQSRPDQGIVRIRNTTRNQRNEIVQTFMASALIPRQMISD